MTNRRRFLCGVMVGLLQVRGALAQTPAKTRRVGILATGIFPRSASFYASFEQRLRDLGWQDGANIVVDFVTPTNHVPLAEAAARMVARMPDVILISGPDAGLKAVIAITRSVPIVIAALNYDPVSQGYVKTLAHPGGNVTGVFVRQPEVSAKQLAFAQEAIPDAARIGVLWTKASAEQIPMVEAAAARLRVQLVKVELSPPYDIKLAFEALEKQRVDAVVAMGDPVVFRERARIAEQGLQRKIPVIGLADGVDAGFLVGFGPDLNATLARAAEYVDRILKGANAGDLPIEQPSRFVLRVNLKTAKALGLTIPQSLLQRADEVVQ